nr:MAG TPA: hypothetical protein [Caudoviricetes sp.]
MRNMGTDLFIKMPMQYIHTLKYQHLHELHLHCCFL